jgi:glutathione peroxidase
VSFPLTEKVEVNGPGRHPLFESLIRAATAGGRSGDVAWNFEKFLVDSTGEVVARFSTRTVPDDPRVLAAIESLLA